MLHITNLSKTFYPGTVNEKKAISNLSLHLQPGEFATVIGTNGAGKSTLFQLIAGALFPDEGTISLDGCDITFQQEYKRSRMIGRVFQDPMQGTAPHMTVKENLALSYLRGTREYFRLGIGKNESKMFQEMLAEFGLGLEERMDTPMGLLSGGQRQAIALLMCTLVTPKLLLLDEHTAALDPATAEKVLAITNTIVSEKQITTMMITHNISSALKLGSRTIMMSDGNIVLDISGQQRSTMTSSDLLHLFHERSSKELDNDRILFSSDC